MDWKESIKKWCGDCELRADCIAPNGQPCDLKPAYDEALHPTPPPSGTGEDGLVDADGHFTAIGDILHALEVIKGRVLEYDKNPMGYLLRDVEYVIRATKKLSQLQAELTRLKEVWDCRHKRGDRCVFFNCGEGNCNGILHGGCKHYGKPERTLKGGEGGNTTKHKEG